MALSGLRYKRFATEAPKETKSGSYIFSGSVHEFHEWEFRTKLRLQGITKVEDVPYVVQKIVEGLRGDAFLIAKDIWAREAQRSSGQGHRGAYRPRPTTHFPSPGGGSEGVVRPGTATRRTPASPEW